MNIYRVLSSNEEDYLIEKRSIYKVHKTCLRPDWLLFDHPEDYNTGKYFFFTMEDAVTYARLADGYKIDSSILEMDIDENIAFQYLGYGKYCYGDYDSTHCWDNQCTHCLPEVFLPYNLIQEKINTEDYAIIPSAEREHIETLKDRDRPSEINSLGWLIAEIKSVEVYIDYYYKQIQKNPNAEYYASSCEKYESKLQNLRLELPNVYSNFVNVMNNYSWRSTTDDVSM